MKKVIIEQNGFEPMILSIPEGASVRIEDGVTVVEPKFKKGDVLIDDDNWIWIFESEKNKNEHYRFARIDAYDEDIYTDKGGCLKHKKPRHATPEQAQILFDAIAKNGKRWDAEKFEVVDLKYAPKVGDCVFVENPYGDASFYFVCGGLNRDGDPFEMNGIRVAVIDNIVEFDSLEIGYTKIYDFTQITPVELQAEFNKRGYEYDFETHTAEKLKYIPKDGDCVRAEQTDEEGDYFCYYFVCGGFDSDQDPFERNGVRLNVTRRRVDCKMGEVGYPIKEFTFTKITPTELQAEFNKLGYEYDFENHTAKKLVWKPKVGGRYKAVNFDDNEIIELIWDNDILDRNWLEMKNVFPPHDTEGIEKYIAHIKSFER